jgi:hypothetical protein
MKRHPVFFTNSFERFGIATLPVFRLLPAVDSPVAPAVRGGAITHRVPTSDKAA